MVPVCAYLLCGDISLLSLGKKCSPSLTLSIFGHSFSKLHWYSTLGRIGPCRNWNSRPKLVRTLKIVPCKISCKFCSEVGKNTLPRTRVLHLLAVLLLYASKRSFSKWHCRKASRFPSGKHTFGLWLTGRCTGNPSKFFSAIPFSELHWCSTLGCIGPCRNWNSQPKSVRTLEILPCLVSSTFLPNFARN